MKSPAIMLENVDYFLKKPFGIILHVFDAKQSFVLINDNIKVIFHSSRTKKLLLTTLIANGLLSQPVIATTVINIVFIANESITSNGESDGVKSTRPFKV